MEEEIWHLLLDVVRRHLISDVPVGISLSAGLDSQFLTHILGYLKAGDYHTFTFGFDEAEYDEVASVQTTDYGIPLSQHYLYTRADDLMPSLNKAIRIFEGPLGGLGTLCASRLMQLPQSQGVKVLLSGEGADEVFGGYKYYQFAYLRDLYEAGDQETLRRETAALSETIGHKMSVGDHDFRRLVLGEQSATMAPDGTSLAGQSFIGPAFEDLKTNTMPQGDIDLPEGCGSLRRTMLRDMFVSKLPKLLMFQDRASMGGSVEVRVPFVDHQLIETVYRLPEYYLIRDGSAKYLLRRMLKRFAGVDYVAPQKRFVNAPQREWLKGPLFDDIYHWLQNGSIVRSGLIDGDSFGRAYSMYAGDPALGNSFFVWKMMNLEALIGEFFVNP